MKKALMAGAALAMCVICGSASAGLREDVAADYPYIDALYKDLHAHPELSFKEEETSKRLAAEMEKLGFDVTTHVGSAWVKKKAASIAGELKPGVDGYGIVAVMRNGDGPTVLIRTDMDALPLEEKTGLDYASHVMTTDFTGQEAPVMHACGHDVHMSVWVGTARRLAAMKDKWSGTLVMIAQPAEEIGLGATAMLEDGLYTRFPTPDYNIALHDSGTEAAGSIAYTEGYALANVDSVDIFVKGVGGHGAYPYRAKDPIVVSAEIINALQTLVSRELDPLEAGVVTVGSIHAGYKHNIIPDEAHLQLTVRSYKDGVRTLLLDGIKRIARAQAESAGLPEKLMPEVKIEQDYTVATYNDPALAEKVAATLSDRFGADHVYQTPPVMGGEDFGFMSRTKEKIPSFIFWLGAGDPKAVAKAKAGKGPIPPSIHSPFFAPVPEPTLKTGVEAMTAAAVSLLNGGEAQ